jgi:hypothetical protein
MVEQPIIEMDPVAVERYEKAVNRPSMSEELDRMFVETPVQLTKRLPLSSLRLEP